MTKHKTKILVGLSMVSLLLAYQNCGPTGIQGSLLSKSNVEEFNFPVKVETNYLGFMSCNGLPDFNDNRYNSTKFEPKPGYFTFKVLSEHQSGLGGLSLDNNFLDAVESERVKRPNSFNLSDEISRALDANTKAEDREILISVFNPTTYKVRTNPYSNLPMSDVMEDSQLDDPDLIYLLKQQTDTEPLRDYKVSGEIDLRDLSPAYFMDSLVQDLRGGAVMVGVNYTGVGNNKDTALYTPADSGVTEISGAYGRMMGLEFYNGNPLALKGLTEYDSRIIDGINQEISGKVYTCRFIKIIRPLEGDLESSGCLGGDDINQWTFLSFQDFAAGKTVEQLDAPLRALVRLIDGDFPSSGLPYTGDNSRWLFNKDRSCMVSRDILQGRNGPLVPPSERYFGCYGSPYNSEGNEISAYYGAYDPDRAQNAHYFSYCYTN